MLAAPIDIEEAFKPASMLASQLPRTNSPSLFMALNQRELRHDLLPEGLRETRSRRHRDRSQRGTYLAHLPPLHSKRSQSRKCVILPNNPAIIQAITNVLPRKRSNPTPVTSAAR